MALAHDQNPENSEIQAPDVETPREVVLSDSVDERIDMNLDRMTGVEQLVDSMDINLDWRDQPEGTTAFESSLYGYMVSAFENADVNFERAQTDIPYLLALYTPSEGNEKSALNLLSRILENQDCKMYAWLIRLGPLVAEAKEFYDESLALKAKIEKKDSAWDELNGKAKTAFWIAAGGIAGAYVVNRLWKWRRTEKAKTLEERELAQNSNIIEGKTLRRAAGALAAATIGYKMISSESVGDWVQKNLGISLAWNDLKESASLLLSGKFSEAWNVLTGGIEVQDPLTLEASSVMNVKARSLLLIEEQNYVKFMSWSASTNREIGSYFFDHMPDPNIPFTPSPSERLDQIEDEKRIAKYLKTRAFVLKDLDPQPETIRDALSVLKEKGFLTPSLDPGEKPDEGAEGGVNLDEDGIPEQLNISYTPHIAAAYDKWVANGERMSDIPELAGDIIDGAKEDGATVVMHTGVVGVWHTGKFLVISTLNVVTQTFMALMDEDGSAIEAYWDAGGMYYMVGGASWATIQGGFALRNGNMAQAMSGIRTGLKIATTPFRLVGNGVSGAQSMYRGANDLFYEAGVVVHPTRYQKLQWMHSRAKYQAELYRKYYEIKYNDTRANQVKRGIMGKKLDVLLRRHGALFSKSYIEFNKLGGVGESIDPWGEGSEDRQHRASDRAKQFTEGRLKGFEIVAESEALNRAKLLSEQRGGTPEQYLDEARQQVHTEKAQPVSRFANHAEAAAAGAVEIAPAQMSRLKNLGVTEQAMLRMREMRLNPEQINKIISQLEPEGTRMSRLRNLEWIMVQEQAGPYWRSFSKGIKVLGVLGAAAFIFGFNQAEDKFGYMVHALSGAGVFMAALAVTERATVGKVPNPIIQQVVAFAGALAISIGADVFWDDTGGFMLDKYSPDREHSFASNTNAGRGLDSFGFVLGGAALGMLEWTGEAVGIGKGVEASTDPIAYLQDTVTTVKPIGHSGWDKSVFEDRDVHTLEDFETYSKKELEDKLEELSEFESSYPEEPNEDDKEDLLTLKSEVARLQSFVDGTWVNDIRMSVELREGVILQPAEQEFRRLSASKFPDGGEAVFDRLMERMRNQVSLIETEADKQVWQFLVHEETEVNGVKISFREFTANRASNVDRIKFLDKKFPAEEGGEEPGEVNLDELESRLLAYEDSQSANTGTSQAPPESGEAMTA